LLVSANPVIVAEADEFDRSFLQLFPDIAAITSMDADHLDIYSDIENMHASFRDFASQVGGTVITKIGLPICESDTEATVLRYSYDDASADFYASDIKVDECGYFSFNLNYPAGVIEGCKVGIPGWINVENAVAASAIALTYGLDPEKVKHALGTFQGVKRRFDIHLNTPTCSYIDDYAHHPNEISAAISSMRDIFPGRRLTAIFQPHLYTRTRDFADEFAQALSAVDKLILLDIYPAREEPIPGVTSEIIFKNVTAPEKVIMVKEELMDYLKDEPIDTLITFGAGNIDRFIGPITEMLCQRQSDI
ncbi:MAG: UDP-N-acetylmuramate--L-alanine ligase, partial [Bacteroidales bacterium]|nr:UDP-N-acetylmuramate--L-alanine ligase [Bacteroidales bacterium]